MPFQNGYDHVQVVWHDDIFIDVNIGEMGLGFPDSFEKNKILRRSGNGTEAAPYNGFHLK